MGLSKSIRYGVVLILFSTLLLACSTDEEEEPEVNNPTPELAVVVFATEEITPTATPSEEKQTEQTPIPAATVGVGISDNAPQEAGNENPEITFVSEPANRAPDINPLTGLQVDDPAVLQRRPLMVRIGNDPGARPQVALNNADLVYEEIVEWWVTRFTAIFLSNDPEMIAPIRSARLINLQLGPQYQGALVNSGGSDGVRWELSETDIINLDEFFVPGPYFYRPNEGWQTRLAFDATAARDYMADEGLDNNVGLQGFTFSTNLDEDALPKGIVSNADVIKIPYPQQTSDTRWEYDPGSGKYLRFVSDEPLTDFNGGQIEAANIIIYFADHQPTDIVEDSNGATSIRIIVNGRGAAWLLRDGTVLTGNWETDGQNTPQFIFDNGQPMPLKPGNTWVQVVPLEFEIDIDGTSYNSLEAASSPGQPSVSNAVEPTEEALPSSPTPTLTPIGAQPQATPESE